VQRVYLEDLLLLTDLSPNLALLRLLVVPEEQAGAEAQAILNRSETATEFQQRLDLVEAILVYKLPQLSIEEIRQMLDLKDTTLKETRFYQEVLQEGEAALLLRLLTRRCGSLSATQQAQIEALPRQQLEALGEALLDFTGMADLEGWLGKVGSGE